MPGGEQLQEALCILGWDSIRERSEKDGNAPAGRVGEADWMSEMHPVPRVGEGGGGGIFELDGAEVRECG